MKRIHRFSDLPTYLRDVVPTLNAIRSGLLCPACDGGRTRERSLSMWIDDANNLALTCWRNGCNYGGNCPLDPGVKIGAVKFKPRVYTGGLRLPSSVCCRYMKHKYGIDDITLELFGVRQLHLKKGLYLPAYSPAKGDRGGIIRWLDGTLPKADTHKHTDDNWLAWYWRDDDAPATVIVEDQFSAMRCWQLGFRTVALMGTNISNNKLSEIRSNVIRNKPCLLALDKDAFDRAVYYTKRYRGDLTMTPVLLEQDIKDVTDNEIMRRLQV